MLICLFFFVIIIFSFVLKKAGLEALKKNKKIKLRSIYSITFNTLPIAIVLSVINIKLFIRNIFLTIYLLSSLRVNLPICGNSLNCSKQIIPEHSILIIATWSCLTNLGRDFDLSPVFLSTKQMRACKKNKVRN